MKWDKFIRPHTKMVRGAGRYRAKKYALLSGAPFGWLNVRFAKTYLGNDWVYFYLGAKAVWNCNKGFFEAHFHKKEEPSLWERLK